MRRFRWLWLLLLVPASPGCLSLHRPQPVPIQVVDAETHAPIAGAKVRLWCPNRLHEKLGDEANAVTNDDGQALLRASSRKDLGIVIEVSAPGYGLEEIEFRSEPAADGAAVGTLVAMFANPRPTVEFVLPIGFQGLFKAEIVSQENSERVGQREFSAAVLMPQDVAVAAYIPVGMAHGVNGVAKLVGSPVLQHGLGPLYRAKFADGKPLPNEPRPSEIGIHFLKKEGDMHYFVVGTLEDWKAQRKALNMDLPASNSHGHRSGGGGGGGGGGRGGRGGGGGMGGGGMGGGGYR
ncbi:MAG TPA: carboxypeptidase-like regulatory domain-containing protein [Gemmataceae bacterium]